MITYLQDQKSLMVKLSSASNAFKLVLTKLLSQKFIESTERKRNDAYYDMYVSAYQNSIEEKEFAEALAYVSSEVDKIMECQVKSLE